MSTPIRPEWTPVLGVLPSFAGGYLEWQDDDKKLQYAAKIVRFELTERTLTIVVKDAMQRSFSEVPGRFGVWEPEKADTVVGPTTSWVVQLQNRVMIPELAEDKKTATFTIIGLSFTLHTPETAFARSLSSE